jgi:hypothetical protein
METTLWYFDDALSFREVPIGHASLIHVDLARR